MDPALIPLSYATPRPPSPFRPLSILAIAATVAFAAIFVGATTNMINGAISPFYFNDIMGFDAWWECVAQGILEGVVFAIALSAVYATTLAILTQGTCTYSAGVRWLALIVCAVYIFWLLGGCCAVALAALRPLFYQRLFINAATADYKQILAFAWVGGSIWGAYIGGPLSVVAGLTFFPLYWRRCLQSHSGMQIGQPHV